MSKETEQFISEKKKEHVNLISSELFNYVWLLREKPIVILDIFQQWSDTAAGHAICLYAGFTKDLITKNLCNITEKIY